MQRGRKKSTRVNLIGFVVILRLIIEKIELICLTLEMFEFKVNVFCRVNLVLGVRIALLKTRY